jgi:hypothetical protein
MTVSLPITSSHADALAIVRKHFKSRGAFAIFARSAEAPRYSATLCSGADAALAATLGVVAGEAVFCDNLPTLQREVLRWKENGYGVHLDKASDHPEIACKDSWAIRAGREVPAWFLENIFQYAFGPQLTDAPADVELHALSELCYQGADCPLHILDRAVEHDHQYLLEVSNDPNEFADWSYTGWGHAL